MLSTKEFLDPDFFRFCQQQYDEARRFLKNCGKPKDEVDRFMIGASRQTASIFGGMLDLSDKAKDCQQRKQLEQERKALLARVASIDSFLS